MCCKTSVHPLDPELAATILTIGQFVPASLTSDDGEIPRFWKRDIPEEQATVNVSLTGGCFEISIAPSISNFDHHLGKRITAGVYFEISAKYAEKVGGEIIQRATVVGCKDTDQGTGLVIARYPSLPMSFERVCAGFQQVLLYDPGHEHAEPGDGWFGNGHAQAELGDGSFGNGHEHLDLGRTA
jgi:hypothetical protein